MAAVFKFVYAIFLFYSLFLAAMNVNGIHILFFYISFLTFNPLIHAQYFVVLFNIIVLFFIPAAIKCETDSNCPQNMCMAPSVVRCMGSTCTCVGSRVLPWEVIQGPNEKSISLFG